MIIPILLQALEIKYTNEEIKILKVAKRHFKMFPQKNFVKMEAALKAITDKMDEEINTFNNNVSCVEGKYSSDEVTNNE